MKKATLGLFLASATITQAIGAQPAPPAAPAPARPAPAAPAPRAPAAAPAAPPRVPAGGAAPTTTTPTPVGEPNLPQVDDPMLVEPPAAARELRTWQEALQLIRTQSPSLKTALARVDVAAAQARQALAGSMPKLVLSGQGGVELIRGTYETGGPAPKNQFGADGQLDLRVPLFAPKAWYDHGTAKRQIEQTRLEVSEIQRQIIAGLAEALVNAVTGERLAEVTRVSLRSALSTLDLNKRRAALGASSTLDVLRAEQEVELARQQVINADESLLRTREALGQALGSSEPWGVTTGIQLNTLSADARRYCKQVPGIQQRPDIIAANSNIGIVERQKGSADRSFWPTLDLGSTLYANPDSSQTQNRENFSWRVGLILNWNIYDGGLRYGQKDEAEANVRVAQESLTQARLDAELEVNRAYRAVKVADAALTVSSRAREISAETARLARIAFLNGSGTSFDLVDNARLLREAELDLTIKEFAVLRARVAALLALASCDI